MDRLRGWLGIAHTVRAATGPKPHTTLAGKHAQSEQAGGSAATAAASAQFTQKRGVLRQARATRRGDAFAASRRGDGRGCFVLSETLPTFGSFGLALMGSLVRSVCDNVCSAFKDIFGLTVARMAASAPSLAPSGYRTHCQGSDGARRRRAKEKRLQSRVASAIAVQE